MKVLSETPEVIKEKIIKAKKKAEEIGETLGYVSRKSPSKISGEESLTVIEVDPLTYYTRGDLLGVGNYVIAVDIRTGKAVGLRIVSLQRSDIASTIETFQPLTLEQDEGGLITSALIYADALLDEDGLPFTSPIEPQSPVVSPTNSELLAKVIGLPDNGVPVGMLHTGSHTVGEGGVVLKLPKSEFFKHIFIMGTTGSGKTTFIKNLIYSVRLSWAKSKVLIIDAAGDYTQIILPPRGRPEGVEAYVNDLKEYLKTYPIDIIVLLPIRRGDIDAKAVAYKYVMERLGKIAEVFYGSTVEIGVTSGNDYGGTRSSIVECRLGDSRFRVEVVPLSLTYPELRDHLEIFPLFSRQAKVYLRNIINFLEDRERGIRNFTHLHMAFQRHFNELLNVLKVHKKTLENIQRGINFIASSEEVDVVLSGSSVGFPSVGKLIKSSSAPVILDLDYASSRGSHFVILNMIAYEFMREVYAWKKSGAGLAEPVLLILDEAHRFFPSEGTSREEVELLADFISRIARLGRARGLGLIFSTHSPKDVHKIVIQLTNTKVVFRSEREFMEMLDIPKDYFKLMELVPDRVGMLRSSALRSGHAIFQTPEPLLGHFDMGRLSAGK